MRSQLFARLRKNEHGGTMLEFALLAPAFMALLIGLFEVGIYMQNYNAVRSLAADAGRFAAVEYQRNNEIGEETLQSNITAMAIAEPYNLQSSRLKVEVDEVSSRVSGAHEFQLGLTYALPDFLGSIGAANIEIEYERPLFVIDNSAVPAPSGTSSSSSGG